jgi:hypothetical protein
MRISGGNDAADYSRDHFFDFGADRVGVHLRLNGGQGEGDEFKG